MSWSGLYRIGRLPVVVITGVIGMASPHGLGAQATEPQTVPDHVACSTCSIELAPVVRLGDREGDGALEREPAFLIRTPGHDWVMAEFAGSRLVVFSPDGRFVRQVGREGQGPGEFMTIRAAYVSSVGHVHVFDLGNRRETVFDETWAVVRTVPVPEASVVRVVPGDDGTVYHNADVGSQEGIGLPLHLIREGEVTRSFGARTAIYRPDAPWLVQRVMAADSQGVWVSPRTAYQLEYWTAGGDNPRVLRRDAPWFEPYLMRTMMSPSRRPQPWVTTLGRISNRELVAAIVIPTEGFAEHLHVSTVTPRGDTVYTYDRCGNVHDTVIEVIDLAEARVVTRSRRDECFSGFVLPDLLYEYDVDEVGVPQVNVFRLRVRRP